MGENVFAQRFLRVDRNVFQSARDEVVNISQGNKILNES